MKLPYDKELTDKIPEASDREQNERLYHCVMAGDEAAREEMIEGNMPLVIVKVDSFIRRYPQLEHLRDDLHGAGFVGLIQAVNKMAKHTEPPKMNPTGYISVAITHEFVKLAKKEAGCEGIKLPDMSEADMDSMEDTTDDVPEILHNIPESVVDANQSATVGLCDLRSLIESCCESDEDRTLIRMREEGHTDHEIAEVTNKQRRAVCRMRHRINERFQEKCRELEDD